VLAAGVNSPYGAIDQVAAEDWIRCFEINVFGVLHCVQEALPSMRKNGEGSIVLFSGAGQAAFPNFSAYAASKGAIWRLTETLGEELRESGIRINAIAPGAVNTRMMKEPLRAGEAAVGSKNFADLKKQESAGGVPASLAADLAHFLLSDHSRGLSGKTISAQWDEYREWKDFPALSRSNLYTFKRVVREDGGTKP
jgi:3-oxoacyl-[acyl-carrier protein] reductase